MMAALHMPLEDYSYQGRKPAIIVDQGEDRTVDLTIEGDTPDDERIERRLTSYEARALAAALLHFADEVERPQ